MIDYFVYALVGRLLIYLIQRFPPAEWAATKLRLQELYECDLCLGFWVYLALAFPFEINIIDTIEIVVVSQVFTAAITSFLVWLIRQGWQDQFGEIVVRA